MCILYKWPKSENVSIRSARICPTNAILSPISFVSVSTYHSMFGINDGINDRSDISKIGQIKAKLMGVKYIFFDKVSMLSARDMYQINLQLARVFDVADIPFGGLSMVFSGDFTQLLSAIGGEHVSLYSENRCYSYRYKITGRISQKGSVAPSNYGSNTA
jgi:hypothetical protein